MSFFAELKRRNVVRMAVLYAVAAWVLLQIADVLFDQLGVPQWAFRLVLGLLILGFPLTLIFSWVFELTPEGVRRTREITTGQSQVQQTGQRMNLLIVVLLLVAIAGLAVDRLIPEPGAVAPAGTEPAAAEAGPAEEGSGAAVPETDHSIAVLPFVNMSGDPDNEYFSDGLSEELLNTLVRVGGLKVTGRTSSFAFKGENRDLREIGAILGVANVLEGSVRKAGKQVRITAQLIKTSDGFHLWSDTFDRELDDIFAIQSEIAKQVSFALHATLLGAGSQDGAAAVIASQDARAYEEYLRGMYIWQRDPDGIESLNAARSHFESALAIDPEYVDALWGMFVVWDRMNRNGHGSFEESLRQMAGVTELLRNLSPNSDRTLAALGRLATVNFEYRDATDYLERAATLYPASVSVLGEFASSLLILQQFETAIETINRAARLDPLSLEIMRWKAHIHYRVGDCATVGQVMDRAMEIEPQVGRFRYYLAMCLFETTGETARPLELAGAESLAWARYTALAILYHADGQQAEAQAQRVQLFERYGESSSYQFGQIYAQWGEVDTALDWLETAARLRDPGIIQSINDRLLTPVRDEPRFRQIQKSIGYD